MGGPIARAVRYYERGELKNARRSLATLPNDYPFKPFKILTEAMFLAGNDKDAALQKWETMYDNAETPGARIFFLQLLLACGEFDRAKREAKRLQPFLSGNAGIFSKIILKDDNEFEQFLETLRNDQLGQGVALYCRGLMHFAARNRTEAQQKFDRACKLVGVGIHWHYWSRAFRRRLQDDSCPEWYSEKKPADEADM